MKKISEPFQIKDRKGFYIRWYENGKERKKHFNTKKEAEHYRHVQYMRLNNDVYTVIDMPFDQVQKEYLATYDSRNLAKESKKVAERVLNKFVDICRPLTTKHLNKKLVDYYIEKRQKDKITGWTLNKDIGRLAAFFKWLKTSGYIQNEINLKLISIKTPPKSKALSDDQIKSLLKACPTTEWQLRILLGLCTGLRKIDLYHLKNADFDFENGTLSVYERKTGKNYTNYIPDDLMPLIKANKAQREYYFSARNSRWLDKQFRDFRPAKAITIQSLRKTFATRIETTSISTRMLNHSGTGITRKFYNDLDYIKYIRVNQLPIKEWLSILDCKTE